MFGVLRLSLLEAGGTRLQFREILPPTILKQMATTKGITFLSVVELIPNTPEVTIGSVYTFCGAGVSVSGCVGALVTQEEANH